METTRNFRKDFDHFDPEFIEHIADITTDLRAHCPVAHGNAYGGFWVLSRYDDVLLALHDEETFSSQYGIGIPREKQDMLVVPVEADPPEHTKYRSLLASWFVARRTATQEAIIRQFVTELLDTFIEQGECDILSALAVQLPASIIAPVMGFEPDEWPLFTRLIKQVIVTEEEENAKARRALIHYLFREIEKRKIRPRDDFLTTLVVAQPDGKLLSGEEVMSLMLTFLAAGTETSAMAVCNMLLRLSDYPDLRQRLIDDASLIPSFVEECLRYDPPLQYIARSTTKDIVLHGQEIKAGERVSLFLGSANRDEEHFVDVDQFLADRQSNRHLAFGHGIHFCIGAPLARLQMRVVLEEVLRRLPDYQVIGTVERHILVGQVYGVKALPIRFTPGPVASM